MIPLPPTRIVLVDDHALYRLGLRTTISEIDASLTIIGECGSSSEFTLMLQQKSIPDLVILDIRLPDESGISIARRLKTEFPQIKIIMLSSEVSEETVSELLEIDVEGYLSKMAQMADVEKAIRTVISGSNYYGQSVAKIMYNVFSGKNRHNAKKKTIRFKERNSINCP
jgi:DNA-binding NarL/FixJ family response regulator